jgi:predicted dinucleotide-binding enzyme
MSNRRTFAVLGVSEIKSIFLAKQIAKTNPVLLFDHDAVVLNTVYSQILSEHPNANAEMMICPTNASWEADVIILSNAAASDSNLTEKIRNVATGKIVLFLENKKNTINFESTLDKLQYLFPFSKVIQSFESADNSNDSFFLNGNDKEAVKTILTLFTSIGLKANIT